MKSIIFNTEEVNAILDGRKTMFRLPIKLPIKLPQSTVSWNPQGCEAYAPFQPGDILWVKETWCENKAQFGDVVGFWRCASCDFNVFGKCQRKEGPAPWSHTRKSPVHMPFEAARIFLLLESVTPERLQDITEDQAKQEGSYLGRCACIPRSNDRKPINIMFNQEWCYIHGKEFKAAWDAKWAKKGYPYDANPGVWVYEFKRVERPMERNNE